VRGWAQDHGPAGLDREDGYASNMTEGDDVSDNLTPTEDLIMDVLSARVRLGEPFWTFEYRHRPALRRLVERGLIRTEPATTEHIEAYLTDVGRAEYLTDRYTPPGARVEWGASDGDDPKPVHYTLRSVDQAGSEDYHRRYAARNDGALFRRWTVVSDWVQVPLEEQR
jgi:hypothetical protein